MINLLPPQERKVLLEEENYKLVWILGVLILISLLALSLVLLSVDFYIEGQSQSQKILVDLKRKEFSQLQPIQEKLALINKNLCQLDSLYQQQVRLTKLLEDVSSKLVSGMYLTNFSYRRNGSRVEISGFSKKRDVLSEFRARMEGEKQFKNVYFPLSNWVESENINFKTTFIWSP